MSIYLALDKSTGDLVLADGGGVARVDDGRFVVQQVQSKLRTGLAEWILNPLLGWISIEDFEKGWDRFDIEARARKIILQTQGVLAVDSMTATYEARKLVIQFEARTIYGTIALTVPWSNT